MIEKTLGETEMTTGLTVSITDELVAELEFDLEVAETTHQLEASVSRDALAALLAERAELKRDADKYRKLRDGADWPAVFASSDAPEPLRDDDLDAAMELQL